VNELERAASRAKWEADARAINAARLRIASLEGVIAHAFDALQSENDAQCYLILKQAMREIVQR